jgi:hypothetical protein
MTVVAAMPVEIRRRRWRRTSPSEADSTARNRDVISEDPGRVFDGGAVTRG